MQMAKWWSGSGMPWSQAGKRSKQLDLETAGQREARLKRTGLNRARQLASETEE